MDNSPYEPLASDDEETQTSVYNVKDKNVTSKETNKNKKRKDKKSKSSPNTSSPQRPQQQQQQQQQQQHSNNSNERTSLVPSSTRINKTTAPTTSKKDAKSLRKTLDSGLRKWALKVKKFVPPVRKRHKRTLASNRFSKKDIVFSVFDNSYMVHSLSPHYYFPDSLSLRTLDHAPPMTQSAFDRVVDSVRFAISVNVQPKMNKFGSSGSYFARDVSGRTIAIFKPKDEEPYGRLNPKYTKWFHRNFLAPFIGFGRACLIPNLSYQSEAAASLLDRLLYTHIVPYTQVVSLSSPGFFYDWIDRRAAKSKNKPKPLPPKQGSFQIFLKGYQDASEFLRKHPWPGRPPSETFNPSNHRHRHNLRKFRRRLLFLCGKAEDFDDDLCDSDQEVEQERTHTQDSDDADYNQKCNGCAPPPNLTSQNDNNKTNEILDFKWTAPLMQDFREQLERLIILDFLMRNTDRGLDNFMIKACSGHECYDYIRPKQEQVDEQYRRPHIHVAAIDNSLAFPHQHPKGWRNYTYGWLWLPVSLIGHPFSQNTRNHFLPLLSSPQWWSNTTHELYKQFSTDPDFSPKMFKRQIAVLKGQGWNLVESLKHQDEGPLELCRRQKVLVWDDEVEIPINSTYNPSTNLSSSLNSPSPSPKRRSPKRTSSESNSIPKDQNRPPEFTIPPPSSTTTYHTFSKSTPITNEPQPLSMSVDSSSLLPQHYFEPGKNNSKRKKSKRFSKFSRPLSTATQVDLDNLKKLGNVTGIAMLEHLEGRQQEQEQGPNYSPQTSRFFIQPQHIKKAAKPAKETVTGNTSASTSTSAQTQAQAQTQIQMRDNKRKNRRRASVDNADFNHQTEGIQHGEEDHHEYEQEAHICSDEDQEIRRNDDDEDEDEEDVGSVSSELVLPSSFNSIMEPEQSKVVIVERLEEINANPTFTCC